MMVQEMIDVLKRKAPDTRISYGFARMQPTRLASWRGDYSQLALGWSEPKPGQEPMTAGRLAEMLEECIGRSYPGWHGGEYRMSGETQVYCDNSGCWTSTRIADIVDIEGELVIVTERF